MCRAVRWHGRPLACDPSAGFLLQVFMKAFAPMLSPVLRVWALCAVLGGPALVLAQTAPPPAGASTPATATPTNSAMDASLFYQLLIGELNAVGGEPGAGYSLILDAARKTNDAALFERAVNIALSNRSGDAALGAARAWRTAQPQSRDANRYVLRILVALNRLNEAVEPLRADILATPVPERAAVIASIPRIFARVADKKLAATTVEQALADAVREPGTAAAAHTAIARARLNAGDPAGAVEAAERAQTADRTAEGPALVGLELLDPREPRAEALVRRYLEASPRAAAPIRMGYARALLDTQRYSESLVQLNALTRDEPDFAESWLVLGTLQLQDNQLPAAETSLQRYLTLSARQPQQERARGQAQAFLGLAQIAERRRDFTAAEAWLNRIENSHDLVSAQTRRASILARQGRMDDARNIIRALPQRNPAEQRVRLMAEIQLLRDHKQYQAAYDLMTEAVSRAPEDSELLYDQAMLAEKLGRLDEMERLLRRLIERKPDYHHAYNALGYSLADRGVRLPEAKALIQKALELSPGDPYITDSLGWVEFRLGNRAEALRILEGAYKQKPDAEIAAHLGEVLWVMGQRQRAIAIWKEGMLLNPENETLLETLKRLQVRL